MVTSGSATGGNDVFSGKNKVFWWMVSQAPLAGAHGQTTIRWAWDVNWAGGDNCHTIQDAAVVGNSTTRWSNSGTVHAFNGSHVHTGDWPTVNSSSGGGFSTGTYTIDHDTTGNANVVLSSHHSGTSGAVSTASGTWALPQIPQTVASPSACSASRVSDTQATVTWTNNSTSNAPYANIKVFRSTDGGAYALIATLGVVTTYSDTGIAANHKYVYRVSAVGTNTVEVGYATASAIYTTPAAATAVTATKQPNSDIVVTWTNNSGYTEFQNDIWHSTDGGANYSFLATASPANGSTYTHTAPSTATTHTYRIRTFNTNGTALNHDSTGSNTVTLLATANPPTGLAPSGIALDATEAIVFTWTHNPADGTPQSKYELQYSTNGGSSWTTVGPTTSSVASYTLPASTLTNAQTVLWKVQTAGQNGTLSSFSSNASFTTSARPTSTISVPGSTYNFSLLTANWTYFQAASSAQTSWHAYLWRKGALGDYSDATLLEEQAGSGTTASASFVTSLLNGVTYGLRVYVTSADGLTSSVSGTELQEFVVTYLPPATVTIVPTYDALNGRMTLDLTGTPAVGGVTVDVSSLDLQRQINGGPWITWVTGITLAGGSLTATVVDTAPSIHGDNNYRAVIYSATPSSALSSEALNTTTETRWGFLSTGNGFLQLVKMRTRLGSKANPGRDKAVYQFAGRPLPVELSGEAINVAVQIQATLFPPSSGGVSSEPEELEALALTTGIVLWRDYRGRRIFGSINTPDIDYDVDSLLYNVSFTVTQVDYNESVV